LPVGAVHEFWITVASALAPEENNQTIRGDKRIVSEFLRSVLIAGHVDNSLWRKVSAGIVGAESLLGALTGSREKQVKSLDQFNKSVISTDEIDNGRKALLIGFVTSLVAQGSLRYLPMALSNDKGSTSAAGLWFALFSASRKENDVMDIANGLGRHLARDLPTIELLHNEPKADISFEELIFVQGDKLNNPQFRTKGQSSLLVELLPGVNAIFPVRSSRNEGLERASLAPKLRELNYLLNNARLVVEDIQNNAGQQAELFEKPILGRYVRGRRDKK